MNIVAAIEEFEMFEMVSFYTIRLEYDDNPEEDTEADKFFKKFMDDPVDPDFEAIILHDLVEQMGTTYGAQAIFFRHEDRASALPPKRRQLSRFNLGHDQHSLGNLTLRLYCSRLNDHIVILFNGDRKTTSKAQDCPNVARYFREANKIQKEIDKDIRDGIIQVVGNKIVFDDDYGIIL